MDMYKDMGEKWMDELNQHYIGDVMNGQEVTGKYVITGIITLRS